MPNPSGLLVYSPPPATTLISPPNSTKLNFLSPPPTATTLRYSSSVKSSSSPSSNSITEFDLYDLLGIDSCSDQSQIKMAYRSLQKRCHPDIAGAAGHDMAIILNDAYSILSNPFLRSAYDKEQSKFTEFKGYTGKPLYSTWMGSDKEDRAVFVDEVKCVGCLKCALFAKNTFAIESNYGRARVVAQWADPEDKIFDAIQTCPVDCISLVERSDLAALEFLMSKQPRGNVRIGAGNTVAARVSNIFVDVKKFQNRFDQVKNNDSETDSRESDLLREARMSAIHAIRSITNLWYWQTPKGGEATQAPKQNMILLAENSTQPGTQKLRDAAAARQEAAMGSIMSKPEMPSSDTATHRDEYWTPKTFIPPPSSSDNAKNNSKTVQESKSGTSTSTNVRGNLKRGKAEENEQEEMKPYNLFFPLGLAVVASAVIRVQVQRGLVGGNSSLVREHTAGYLAAEIVNSSWLQTILAGVTWYVIGMLIVELVDILRNRK